MNDLVRLSLVFPPRLETALTEALVAGAGLPGFTLLQAEGHSSDFSTASAAEQVHGRVQRRVLWMLLPRAQVDTATAAASHGVPPSHSCALTPTMAESTCPPIRLRGWASGLRTAP